MHVIVDIVRIENVNIGERVDGCTYEDHFLDKRIIKMNHTKRGQCKIERRDGVILDPIIY